MPPSGTRLIIACMMKGARLLIAVTAALAAGDVFAADRVDVSHGEALARQWCTECHVIDRGNRERLYDEVPTFSEIAALPSTTEVSLRAFLQTPHRRMPNFRLVPAEIDELVGYILDLKEKSR
ncbi:MAG TPA: cytochrome c [Stellaceae bacterium]|nr:cytochrome c [Stellaceae bacterium]